MLLGVSFFGFARGSGLEAKFAREVDRPSDTVMITTGVRPRGKNVNADGHKWR